MVVILALPMSRFFALLLYLLGGIGFAARFLLNLASIGTNDIETWQRFGFYISEHGLNALYHVDPLFNHPPLAGWFAAVIYRASALWDVPFPQLFRIPGILADCVVGLLLVQFWKQRTPKSLVTQALVFCGFAWSLSSLLVSGYHGNTDSLYAMLSFVSVLLIRKGRGGLIAGIVLGLSCNVKIIPVILLPVILALAKTGAERRRVILGFCIALVPFAVQVVVSGSVFVSNVLLYPSFPDYWGVMMFIRLATATSPLHEYWIAWYGIVGRIVIVAGITVVCWYASRKRIKDGFLLAAVCLCIFAVAAPGFAGQYFCLFPPFLFALSPRWGFGIATLTGFAMVASYYQFLVAWYPLHSVHTSLAGKGTIFLGFQAWLALVVLLVKGLRAMWLGREFSAVDS